LKKRESKAAFKGMFLIFYIIDNFLDSEKKEIIRKQNSQN
jgi:hypothetical protein